MSCTSSAIRTRPTGSIQHTLPSTLHYTALHYTLNLSRLHRPFPFVKKLHVFPPGPREVLPQSEPCPALPSGCTYPLHCIAPHQLILLMLLFLFLLPTSSPIFLKVLLLYCSQYTQLSFSQGVENEKKKKKRKRRCISHTSTVRESCLTDFPIHPSPSYSFRPHRQWFCL